MMIKTIVLTLFTAIMSVLIVVGARIEAGRKSEPFHWVTGR